MVGIVQPMETPSSPEPRRLLRSRTQRMVAGVCGGLGEYFHIDPTIIRVIFAALMFSGGAGVGIYVLLWLFVPEAGMETADISQRVTVAGQEIKTSAESFAKRVTSEQGRATGRVVLGVILVVAGAMAMMDRVTPWHVLRGDVFWPVVVIAFGAWVMFKKS